METTGIKYDEGKPAMDLIPAKALMEVGKVMGCGAKKYTRFNWKGGLGVCRLLAAALRHVFQFISGETVDKETGLNHLAHAACCCLMALETYIDRPDLDDRYKVESITEQPSGIELENPVRKPKISLVDDGMTLRPSPCGECERHVERVWQKPLFDEI